MDDPTVTGMIYSEVLKTREDIKVLDQRLGSIDIRLSRQEWKMAGASAIVSIFAASLFEIVIKFFK